MNPHHPDHAGSDCEAIEALIPDYAFGLTDLEQTRFVEANLNSCLGAADQLLDFQRIQAEMREAVPQIAPPAHLEARLMAAIAVSSEPVTTTAVAPVLVPLNKTRRLNAIWAAAAVAILALVVTNVFWLTRVDELTRRQNELEAQVLNASTETPTNTLIVNNPSGGIL